MKNITVSVPQEVYQAARIRAAERGTSVSALVAEYLAELSRDNAEFARLEEQQRRIVNEITQFKGSDRIHRTDVHDRALR
jgi:Family of unknown function (DUF6364)